MFSKVFCKIWQCEQDSCVFSSFGEDFVRLDGFFLDIIVKPSESMRGLMRLCCFEEVLLLLLGAVFINIEGFSVL